MNPFALVGLGVTVLLILAFIFYPQKFPDRVICAWCRVHLAPKEPPIVGKYSAGFSKNDVTGAEETWFLCSLRCRNAYEASHGVKEDRKREINGE